MPLLYFALLHKAMAAEECDARGDAIKYKSLVHKKTFRTGNIPCVMPFKSLLSSNIPESNSFTMKNRSVCRWLLLFFFSLCLSTAIFAKECTVCVTNSYGEQSYLILSETKPGSWTVTGTHDYSIFGGTVWPVQGTYSCITKKLYYTATNPNPDNCALWANTVSFDYLVSGMALDGSFSNDCGMGKAFSASAVFGACKAYSTTTMKKGETGTTGSHKISRSIIKLPKGDNIEALLKDKKVEVKVLPNPAVQFAQVSFTLENAAKVQVKVYNQKGELVTTLADATLAAGTHNYRWNLLSAKGVNVQRGFYWIRVMADQQHSSTQIFVEK